MAKETQCRNDVVADLKQLVDSLPNHKREAVLRALREVIINPIPQCPVDPTEVSPVDMTWS